MWDRRACSTRLEVHLPLPPKHPQPPPGTRDCDHTHPQLILNAQLTSIQGRHLVWAPPPGGRPRQTSKNIKEPKTLSKKIRYRGTSATTTLLETTFLRTLDHCREETTKGQFRKRALGECALVPVVGTGEHPNVPSSRLVVHGNIRMYPRSGSWYRGTSAKTTFLRRDALKSLFVEHANHQLMSSSLAGPKDSNAAGQMIQGRKEPWWTFRIFFIFAAWWEGKGESGATGRGGFCFY